MFCGEGIVSQIIKNKNGFPGGLPGGWESHSGWCFQEGRVAGGETTVHGGAQTWRGLVLVGRGSQLESEMFPKILMLRLSYLLMSLGDRITKALSSSVA